jgi:protein TonB
MKKYILSFCLLFVIAFGLQAQQQENEILTMAEQMPEFDGDLSKYLARTIIYPAAARDAGIEGRVVVQFTVKKDGTLEDIEVIKSANDDFSAEVKRVVAAMPAWKPGKQNGKSVNVRFTLPVSFKLDQNKKSK